MKYLLGPVVQSEVRMNADPGVALSIQVQLQTFIETDHDIFPKVILPLPLIKESLLSVTSESISMAYWLTPWYKLAQEKCG